VEENGRIRERLRRILEGLPCGVLVMEAGSQISILNPEAQRLLGGHESDANSLSPLLLAALEQARETGEERELSLPSADGVNTTWVAVRHAWLEQEQSHSTSVFILRDVSAAKKLELEREQLGQQQALVEMSALLAHEIRNPLGSLELFAGLLAEANLEGDSQRWIEHVQAVTDAALAHLEVSELLNVLLPRIRDILRTDTCAVLLLDEETNELVARAALGIEEEVGVRIPVGAGFAGRVADEARPMVIDVDEYPVYNPILREKQLKSMVGVPLLVRGESLGVLHVGTLTPRIFTHDEVELLQLVAQRVAIAIERAQLHEELIQLDQLKLNFVSVASHELRTPATSVYGVLKTLSERGPALNEELREELLRVGVEQGERLRSLLEELLDLSRLDARAITVEPRPIVLKAALADVVHGALASSDAVDLDIPDDLAAVVDPLVLERVISNLVANAVRYGAPPIRIVAQQRDRHLRIAVEDAGPGVPEDLEGRIFDRFARGGGESGHGLGLAIARAYAQAHGGDLIYDARPSGARFELLIPQERNGLSKPA